MSNRSKPSFIHPTCIISSKAEIGEACSIGPYCTIGPFVRLGSNCTLHSHVVLDGHLTIGDHCEFFPYACIGMKTQDLKYKGETTYVEIGTHNVFREYVTVNAATDGGNKTKIGNNCLIQSYCHIAHDCNLADHVLMSSGAMLSGHVEIDNFAVIGGYVGVVQFVKIGTMAMVGGYSKLGQDVLPYCIVEGVPAETRSINKIGMERNGKSSETIKIVNDAFKKIMRSGLSLEEVTKILSEQHSDSMEVADMLNFITRSRRGLARPRPHKKSPHK